MSVNKVLNCFKAYDVRGKVGEELNEEIAYRIGRATAQFLGAKTVVLGFDVRETSFSLAQAVSKGIIEAGADVLEIGCAGTEEMYCAVLELTACAGIEVTASHNPIEYNGMKFVKKGAQPLSENEFFQIKHLSELGKFLENSHNGSVIDVKEKARTCYVERIIRFVNLKSLKPVKILINSGNGTSGPTIDELKRKLNEKQVETNFLLLNHHPDSSFPDGIPNPLIEENRKSTINAVLENKADFGVAFDGDFDRCFLFDHLGNFIPGEYVVGILAEVFLNKQNKAVIIHDPRVIWNTMEIVQKYGGQAIVSKTGHTFMKAAMRKSGAIYGGEMSAHHYFRDFGYCDSGMIPWLLVWELISKTNLSLADLVSKRKLRFPSSGEINFMLSNSDNCLQQVKEFYSGQANTISELDGLSVSFDRWRFNLRQSNTEPLVRLNIETKADVLLLKEKTKELTDLISNV